MNATDLQKICGCGKAKSPQSRHCMACATAFKRAHIVSKKRFGERVPRHLRFDNPLNAAAAAVLLRPDCGVPDELKLTIPEAMAVLQGRMNRAKHQCIGGGGWANSSLFFVVYRALEDDFVIYLLFNNVWPGLQRLIGPNPEGRTFKRQWGTWFNYQIHQAAKKLDAVSAPQ